MIKLVYEYSQEEKQKKELIEMGKLILKCITWQNNEMINSFGQMNNEASIMKIETSAKKLT